MNEIKQRIRNSVRTVSQGTNKNLQGVKKEIEPSIYPEKKKTEIFGRNSKEYLRIIEKSKCRAESVEVRT